MVATNKPKNTKRNSQNLLPEQVDPDSVIVTGSENNLNEIALNSTPMITQFAILKYGTNLELMFNINCQVQHIIDYFMVKCKDVLALAERENIDVCDLEGNLKNINRERIFRKRLTSDFLKAREVYVLVEMKPTEMINYFNVQPLLVNSEIVTPSFLTKLCPKPPKNLLKGSNKLAHRNSLSSSISTVSNGSKGASQTTQANGHNATNNNNNTNNNSSNKYSNSHKSRAASKSIF